MENVNLLPDNEYTEVDGRRYLNPNLPVERTDAFIDNLRNIQQNNTQQINTDTQRLGTNVPSDLGGLTGASSYFTSRYQTPQTNSVAQGLRTAARASALTQALENEQAMWKKRYQDAYRSYQKRQNDKTNTPTANPSVNVIGIDVNDDGNNEEKISQYKGGQYEKETIYPSTDFVSDWQDSSGQWWQVANPNFRDVAFGPEADPLLYKKVNGNIVSKNGQDYIYIDDIPNQTPQWYRATRSAGPGTYSAYAGS